MATAVPASTTQTPAGSSRNELKRDIANYVQAAHDSEELGIADRAIDNGLAYLNQEMWFWNIKSDDLTLVAGTKEYSLNSDVKKPRQLQVLDTSSNPVLRLNWVSPEHFWDVFPRQDSSGTPAAYTIVALPNNGKLTLNIPPDASYVASYPTIRLQYTARLTSVDDGPPEVSLFLLWYGRYEMAATHGTSGQIDRAFLMQDRIYKRLLADDRNTETDY